VVDGRVQLKSLHTSTVSLAQMGDALTVWRLIQKRLRF